MENSLRELKVGFELPVLKKKVRQEDINLYARASRDFNPIHIDEEFARQTPAGGTIAHGMLVLAYVSQMMTGVFGENWLESGQLNVRFKTPAHPGDNLTISGKVKKCIEENTCFTVTCDVLCANEKGETVISGETVVRVKKDENRC
ncbi:MAG: MaoC family dehydratase [Dehalococcoidales bacterium]|jgi:acyl dehydratase|nr:MaoC family dehydratase [Dehalococcoidales bacterium]